MNVMMTPNNREEFPHINDTANTSLIDNGGKVKKIINNKKIIIIKKKGSTHQNNGFFNGGLTTALNGDRAR